MSKRIFFYINSNHISVLVRDLESNHHVKAIKIENLEEIKTYNSKFILFNLTGQMNLREREEKLINDILEYPSKNDKLFIITPFDFESGVDLKWVKKQIQKLNKKKICFTIFELDEYAKNKRTLTLDQVFNEIEKEIADHFI